MKSFLNFEQWLANRWGYNSVIHFEDSIVLLCGVFLGMLIMAMLCGRVVFKLRKVNQLGKNKVKLFKLKYDGGQEYIADPHNVGESIETLLLVIFRPLFQKEEYTYRDEKRTKIFLITMGVVGTIIFILALMCVSSVIVDNLDILK